jgi:hypothetical protein
MKYLKYLPWLLIVLAVGYLAFTQYQGKVATQALLSAKNNELQKADLDLGRAKTILVEQADLHRSRMAVLKTEWQKEIEKRQATLMQLAQLEGKYQAEVKKRKIVTKVLWKERHGTTELELPVDTLYVKRDGKFQIAHSLQWNYKDFRITITGDAIQKTISYKLHQKFRGQFVETKLPTGGRNHYARIYEVDPKGKIVQEIDLTDFEVLRAKESSARMYWWNPKLDLGMSGAITTGLEARWMADIGLSLAGHGVTPDDLRWRFLRIAAGVSNETFSLSVSPVQYNIGKHLPLVSNMWLTPTIGLEPASKAVLIGLGIAVTL